MRRVLVMLLDASNENDTKSGNGAAMRAFLALQRLPASARMRAEEIDAQVIAERNAWD